ncbi:hypothetical protein PI125_g25074 [Phytophthora idaei]|nr:hypothetical protein PI125_g25074 [Phytophthora idaei]
MDLSYAEGEEAELLAAEQRIQHPSMLHVREYPLSAGKLPSAHRGAMIRRAKPLARRGETATPSRRRAPYWGRTEFCWASGRQRATGPSPEESWAL